MSDAKGILRRPIKVDFLKFKELAFESFTIKNIFMKSKEVAPLAEFLFSARFAVLSSLYKNNNQLTPSPCLLISLTFGQTLNLIMHQSENIR